MAITFVKMHGLGNDFVVINNTTKQVNLTSKLIQQLSNRQTGIGFDQLLLLEAPISSDVDFTYRIFNCDGHEVEQCGNGARCIARYLHDFGLTKKNLIRVATMGGVLELKLEPDGFVTVNMGIPQFVPHKIPIAVGEQRLQYDLILGDRKITFGSVSLGNPHAVINVNSIADAPVVELGQQLQKHSFFPQQVNVGFMERITSEHIRLRVFERGVGETAACGSGACAAVAVGKQLGLLSNKVKVELLGGVLYIEWDSISSPIYMTGPAQTLFIGEWLAMS